MARATSISRGRVDFSEFLNIKVDDIEGPPTPPLGHYYAKIKSWKTREVDYKQGNGLEKCVTLYFEIASPCSDVDEAELSPEGVKGVLVSKDYTEDSLKSLRRAIESVVGEENAKGQQLPDALNMLPNMDCILYMDQRPGKGEREGEFFPVVKKVLPADAEIG